MSFCIAVYNKRRFVVGADSRITYPNHIDDDYEKIYKFARRKAGAFSPNLGTFIFNGITHTFTSLM